jgi:superfamily I DNA/RNA helicase
VTENWTNETNDEAVSPVQGFEPARFRIELGLPPADGQFLAEAAKAVREEFRACSKWKRLRCRKVSVFAERDRGTVYVVHVGASIEFDWTWEGAVAFRPRSLDDNPLFSDFDYESAAYEDEIVWTGEIIEVDERNGCLFIAIENPEAIPTTGSFFVRPFDFLSALDAVFHDPAFDAVRADLPSRLAAAKGGIHPPAATTTQVGLPEMSEWWQHSWCVLWGPPGTGKTYSTGQQIAAVLSDPEERILVVSTTNRATDAVAISIGSAARISKELDEGRLLRIGKGASLQAFKSLGLEAMLRGTESEVLHKIDDLADQLEQVDSWEEKALTRKQIGDLRSGTSDRSRHLFVDPEVRVVISTAFKAMSRLKDTSIRKMFEQGKAPFTTIFIDEAGLMSRVVIVALSLLTARRVVLVGDSKQLAPISRISRILPTQQQTWLASSGLGHLDDLDDTPQAVHVLSEQWRMHPDVCRVVSDFQYGGHLKTADEVLQRPSSFPQLLATHSRAIWYVLDEEATDLAQIRAERGPGNKSWVRSITPAILEKLFSDTDIRSARGLFISPYKAQAQVIAQWLARERITTWEASTVHSQQGSEADIVLFDTVNAGSYSWPFDEWKRLVNVALSRAREAVIVLASRSEMDEPYLKPLLGRLTPSVLVMSGDRVQWKQVSNAQQGFRPRSKPGNHEEQRPTSHGGMGEQVAQRREMTPVLSREQQRLTDLTLDGKPRLVRGVAGSGKSVVLTNWLAKTAKRLEHVKEARIWAVYANRSLHKLLQDSVEAAWHSLSKGQLFQQAAFPWDRVALLHVKDVLAGILPSAALSMDDFGFDYDRAAEEFLNRHDAAALLPRCTALFIDEAQDMGPSTLKLLLSIVQQTDPEDPNSRAAHIFYDNAQNIYGRKTPKWSEFGLDMRGRSTIMRESFRSTTPITELAVNVRHRLTPADQRQDQNELLGLGLIEKTERNSQEWLRVRFNQVDGPVPKFQVFKSRVAEIDAIAQHLTHLIRNEGISPGDICVIYNGQSIVQLLESRLGPKMAAIDVELSVQTNRPFERQENTLVVTTSHSFKGYESEVVIIPGVDQYVTGDGQVLANNLYVAMTRARSLLSIFGLQSGSTANRQVTETIASCVDTMNWTPPIETPQSIQDDLNDILERIGPEHRQWLVNLWKRFEIVQEPIQTADGQVLAKPLFCLHQDGQCWACFGTETVSHQVLSMIQERGIRVLLLGADPLADKSEASGE